MEQHSTVKSSKKYRLIRSGIGIRLFLIISLILLVSMTIFAVLAVYLISDFGEFSSATNETSIRQQTNAFLGRLVHEQALRYEEIFKKISASSSLIAKRAGYFLDYAGSAAPAPSEKLFQNPLNTIFSNPDDSPVMVNYWGSSELTESVRREISALSHIDQLLSETKKNMPECLAAYVVTATGIRRYCPNIRFAAELPIPTEYDLRSANFYVVSLPENNPERTTVWTNIYQDDADRRLVLTAASPVYSKDGRFLGAAGIDLTLDTVLKEILARDGSTVHVSLEHVTPFLLDRSGIIIAISPSLLARLGLKQLEGPAALPGVVLVRSLFDSTDPLIRKLAENITSSQYHTERIALDGEPCIVSTHSMPSTGWRLGLIVPERSVLQSVAETRNKLSDTVETISSRFAGATVVFLFVGLAMVLLAIRYLINPLNQLTDAAEKVREGDLSVRVAAGGRDEIGRLSDSFNAMVAGLDRASQLEKQYTDELEQSVRERAAEILVKNRELEKALEDIKREVASRKQAEEVLTAREQELRAVNQHLMSSEQQLRMANQQLKAGNRQLQESERQVRESHEFLEKIFETTIDGILVTDNTGVIMRANRAMERMLGYRSDELVGTHAADLWPMSFKIDTERQEEKSTKMKQLFEEGKVEYWETDLFRKDGSACPVEIHMATRKGSDEKISETVAAIRDISDRKRAEEERLRLSSVVENTAALVTIMGPDGSLQYINPATECMMGYTLEEVRGTGVFSTDAGQYDKEFYQKILNTLSRGTVWAGTLTNLKKDGSQCEIEAVVSPLRDPSGNIAGFVSTGRDVTNEVHLKKQLQQAQKLEAIGTLAGGIAHDFNNILATIIGYAQLALLKTHEQSEIKNPLEQVLRAGDRARDLVQQILTFSRQSEQESKPVSITPIIKETLQFLRASLPTTISIIHDIQADYDIVISSPTQIQQVLMNLCTNAKQAMQPGGGTIEVCLKCEEVPDGSFAGQVQLSPGSYLKLTVKDTGHGIEQDVLERIFDPFFTTKSPGEGTGLGLSVVHGIVKSIGGSISVSSKPGAGTVFTVHFPLADSASALPEKTMYDNIPGGDEQILMVDDEEEIVLMSREMLEYLGYRVTIRTSSVEALEVFRAQPGRFDLVITDQTMPNMTGTELARELMSLRSDIPIILCTGFSEVINESQALSLGIRAFLNKPLVMAEFSKTIRSVLDREDQEAAG